MKAAGNLLVAALAAAGMTMAGQALADGGSRGGGHSSGGRHSGGHWSGGTHRGSYGGHWSGGTHRGSYSGHWSGGHWAGHRSHWYGPRLGFYFGVPVVLGLGYWGYPYWGAGYWGYPYETVVYREVIREPEVIETVREPAPGDAAPRAEPAPGPLYMNYCESAREYYPTVTRCPEGWKFVTPTS